MKPQKRKLYKTLYAPKLVISGIAIGVVLAITGSVGALNGWFGGGGSIPEDTMTRGLVGYWPFDEATSTVAYDSSGNANHGTLGAGTVANMPSWGGSTTTCKVGGCLSFDGTNDYVDAGNNSVLNFTSQDFTIEAWVKYSSTGGGEQQVFIRGLEATDGYNLFIDNTNDNPVFRVSQSGANQGSTGNASTIIADTWQHLVGVRSGTAITLYVNGSRIGQTQQTLTDPTTSTRTVKIGIYDTLAARQFNGLIDEVRIYNKALSASEVRYHYNRGAPVAQWKFDEGEGRTAYDSTDNNNDGTLILAGSATSSAWVAGKYGSAISFDGVDDYVDIGNTSQSTVKTISFWLKADDITSRKIIDIDGTDQVEIDASSQVTATSFPGTVTYYLNGIAGSRTLTANTWQHVVITDTTGVNASNMDIGRVSTGYFSGLIDDIRIYNYARTPEEIRLDYNAGFSARFGLPAVACGEGGGSPAACMTQGLVGYWAMDEGSGGQAYDASNYANHGTTSGGPSWTKGKVGSALNFDGSNDYVDLGSSTIFGGMSELTMEAWVKPTAYPSAGTAGRIIHRAGPDVETPNRFVMDIDENGYIRVAVNNAGNIKTTVAVSLNTYTHIVGTYNHGAFNIYFDGVLKASGSIADQAITSGSIPLYIGGDTQTTGRYFNGLIDEVRIYNRALSAEEVRYHYNRGGPVAHWKFDEGTGGGSGTVYDSTDNNNDGTLILGNSGNTATSSAWVSGKYGSALKFDSVDDRVTTNVDMHGLSSFTYSIWLYPLSNTNATRMIDFAGGRATLDMNYAATNLAFSVQNTTLTNVSLTTSYLPPINTWTFLEATYDGSIMKIYVNGVLLASKAQSGAVDDPGGGSRTTIIGGPVNYSFNGTLDDIRIYNYARTQEEIRLDYNAGFAAKFGASPDCKTNPGSCMTNGLVGYWPFDEATSTMAYDSSGNANHGTLGAGTVANMPSWGGSTTTCKVAGCLSFDGTNDYMDAGNAASLNITNAITIEAWIKATGVGTAHDVIYSKQDTDGNNGIRIMLLTGNTLYLQNAVAGVNQGTAVDFTSYFNTWAHIVGIYDGSNFLRTYINGVLLDTTSDTRGIVSVSANAQIGRSNAASQYFAGLIDEVRIYNRALSAEEVRYHYNRGGPVAQWKFDEGEGRTAYDSTDNNNDGTLVLAGSATSTAWVSGKSGSALNLDGVNDYISIADSSSLDVTTAFSIAMWVKPNADSSGLVMRLIDKSNGGGGDGSGGYMISANENGFELLIHNGVSNDVLENGTHTFLPGIWKFGVATFNGGVMNLYLDGVPAKTKTSAVTSVKVNTNILAIGSSGGLNQYFNGLIDDVRIYNYARTQEQIMQDYNSGFSARFR